MYLLKIYKTHIMKDSTVVVFIVVSMVILLIISLSVLWFFYHTQNKIIKLKLKEQAAKIEYHKNLLLNTIKTQENERARIAGELHDDVASKLNVVHLNIHLLKKLSGNTPEHAKIIDHIETSLNESIHRTRVISHELMPQVLKKFGFHYALHELAQSINVTGSFHLFVKDSHLCEISDDFKILHLFRIIQELLSNTIKYARAQYININFEKTVDHIIMTYQDDGIGFDAEKSSEGLGLYNIKTRSELLGGDVTFKNSEEQTGSICIVKFKKDE
jgi:two-component system NarL family sensor kinase